MRIKKLIRSLLIIVIVVLLLIIVITNSKHVWKIFGYAFCEDIDNIQVYSTVRNYTQSSIVITGEAKEADGYYSGYSYNIKDNKLYIGIKYNKYYGYDSKAKDFKIEIMCKLNDIKGVYLVDGTNERKI